MTEESLLVEGVRMEIEESLPVMDVLHVEGVR